MTALADTVAILDRLIAFPTVSADGNRDLIDYAAGLLEPLGARVSVSSDETGAKANLFATIGPEIDGGIVLSGHSDVVPVEGQAWTTDPFRLVERDGRLYGRGTCDMKGFIAAALAMAPRYARLDLARPLHIALTYDEEIGCFGARALVEELKARRIRPGVAIIGEPTEMRVIEGHKGCYEYTTEFTGLEGHASLPQAGVNAIEYAVLYAARLIELADELRARAPEGSRFEPPWTTLQVGRIDGGIARNVIAGHCTLDWEMRPVQLADAAHVKDAIARHVEGELLPAMRAVSPAAGIVTHVVGEVEGLEPMADSEARRIVMELTGANGADLVAFGTEAGLFQSLGISTVVCGPGSIAQAHKPDEFLSLDELAACLAMLDRLSAKLAA